MMTRPKKEAWERTHRTMKTKTKSKIPRVLWACPRCSYSTTWPAARAAHERGHAKRPPKEAKPFVGRRQGHQAEAAAGVSESVDLEQALAPFKKLFYENQQLREQIRRNYEVLQALDDVRRQFEGPLPQVQKEREP